MTTDIFTQDEQNFLLGKDPVQKKKKKKLKFNLFLFIRILLILAILLFLARSITNLKTETPIYEDDAISISFKQSNHDGFELHFQNENNAPIFLGITDLRINGQKADITNAELTNTAYKELQNNKEELDPMTQNSYSVQKALGLFYTSIDQQNDSTVHVNYSGINLESLSNLALAQIDFTLSIYSLTETPDKFNTAQFAAVDEQNQFVYLRELKHMHVEIK